MSASLKLEVYLERLHTCLDVVGLQLLGASTTAKFYTYLEWKVTDLSICLHFLEISS